ncbi:MAG TPA: hypothetical protein VMU22_08575 [Rhizomicrobium sp.]|nr:hypothetical protein [Rhizomicrobium sp.]
MTSAQDVLLVGSIPLGNSEAVFRALATRLGTLAPRYPDGETGPRTNWIRWQRHIFDGNDAFELMPSRNLAGIKDSLDRPFFRLKQGASEIAYKPLGFAEEATKSFAIFSKLKRDGVIPAATRFQVSIPTVVAILGGFVVLEDRASAEPALERAMEREVTTILEAIPHQQLSLQWDVCVEIVGYDGGYQLHLKDILPDSARRLARMSSIIPDTVEVGIHLCYGDPGHRHIIEPSDAGSSVKFANAIALASNRPLNWLHIPIPRGWTEARYYEPLSNLKREAYRDIYLGLLHFTDGREGAERRASIAKRFIPHFGLATECGFGRRDPSTVPALLDLHRDVAAELARAPA